MIAKADGAGLGDTATTGPYNTTLTFHSSAVLMTPSDFINGTNQQTISVRLSIVAVPYVNETQVTITRSRSSGAPVGPAEPIEAGEKLTVSVKAVDFEGLPISRPDLQLRLEIRGNLNKNHSIPLQLMADGTSVYTASISETWVREQETVQSDAFGLFRSPRGSRPVALPLTAAARAAFRIHQRAAALARAAGGLLSHVGRYVRCHVFEATADRGAQQQAHRSRRHSGRDHHACASSGAVRPTSTVVVPGAAVPVCRAAITRSAPPQVLVCEARHTGKGGAALDRAA
jgi:hypothetical protein